MADENSTVGVENGTVGTEGAESTVTPAVGGTQESFEPLKPFMAQYEKNLQTNEELASLGGHTEVAKAYLDLKGKLDNAVIKPSTEASDEERAEYFKALGRPDDPTGYELKSDVIDNAEAEEFRKVLHEAGAPKELGEKIFNWYAERFAQGQQQYVEKLKADTDNALAELKKEWGSKYEENQRFVKMAYDKFVPEEMRGRLDVPGPDGTKLGDQPWVLNMFATIGREIAGDSLPQGDKARPNAEREFLKRRYPNTPEMFG